MPATSPARPRNWVLLATRLSVFSAFVGLMGPAHAAAQATDLQPYVVKIGGAAAQQSWDGTVEALRQTVVAAQVPGAVLDLRVQAGDAVQAGQVLLKLDARAAQSQAGAAAAQVQAARAQQEVATQELERQRKLFAGQFISRAALDQAEAQFKAASAQAQAQLAQAQTAHTQSDYYVVKAPYAGVVSERSVMPGDMAMPGRPLLTLYDPSALRVVVALPESLALPVPLAPQSFALDLAGQRITPARVELLPALDPATHTRTLRLELPKALPASVRPGSFARAWLPALEAQGAPRAEALSIPARALVQRAELRAVYVIDAQGQPQLRLVRVGAQTGAEVRILSGLRAGERIALNPQAATRLAAPTQPE